MIARLLLLLALLLPTVAFAEERILSYDSEVEIRADGNLDVVEHIRVRAEGSQIRRGIYRDFPTRYSDRHGNRVVVGFEVLEVRRDGRPEPWFTERVANGVRINTGGDALLPVPADYTYSLRYRTTRQVGFFAGNDELYWNAIGHGWNFPIDAGSVQVRLPRPVPIADMTADGYSGVSGAVGRDFARTFPAPGVARWQLRWPLQAGEGLTTVLSFPKGVVAEPSRGQRVMWLLNDNRGVLVALAGLVLLLVFCVLRWRRIGRDPPQGTVIVRYEPPSGHSPAGLRYMTRMNYDTRCFSADLLASAVDGAVTIHRQKRRFKDDWRIEKADGTVTTAEQRALLERLFTGGRTALELDNANASTMQSAIQRHSTVLASRFQPAMFSRNGRSIGAAGLIALAAAAAALAVSGGNGIPLILLLVAAMTVALVVFANLIKAPTLAGRRLLDEIEGLKRYLAVADRDELARLAGPEAPPTLDAARYERLLPYAVALEVEEAWTTQFTLAVGTAAAAAATSAIAWYHGGSSGTLGSFASTIGSNLSSQISASSTPPGSTSGGGGGGSSGGGGGGGGGGGR